MARFFIVSISLALLAAIFVGCGGGVGSGVVPAPFMESAGSGVPFDAAFYLITAPSASAPAVPEHAAPLRAGVRTPLSFAQVSVNGIHRGDTNATGQLLTTLDRAMFTGTLEVVALQGAKRATLAFRLDTGTPARIKLEVEMHSESALQYDLILIGSGEAPSESIRGIGLVTIGGVAPVIDPSGDEPTVNPDTPSGAPLIVTFLDVGQGDAALVEFPTGEFMVIDAADSSSGNIALPAAFTRMGRMVVDWAILSHPHEDHIGGFPYLFQNYTVRSVADSGSIHTTVTFNKYLQEIMAREIPYNTVAEGDVIHFGSSVEVRILQRAGRYAATDLNNSSLVLKITYHRTSFLFCGDIEREAELSLSARHRAKEIDLASTVIKVPHHGSNTSHEMTFIKYVAAEVGVISVGAGNRYSHPSPLTLDRYAAVGTRTIRTDLSGTVIIVSDGSRITTTTER